MNVREANPITVAVVGIAILLGLLYAAANADNLPIIGGGTTYTAYFSEDAGLKSGQEVRVAGVRVGKVTDVSLSLPRAGDSGTPKVRVAFRVKHTWVGDASTVAIEIKTILGGKYLSLDPLGAHHQNPHTPIPLARTLAPYDVTQAFDDLGQTIGQLNQSKLAQSFETIATTFRNTPPSVGKTLDGLASLAKVISSKDAQLAELLRGAKDLSGTLASQNDQFTTLIKDGNLLLGELDARRTAIHNLLTASTALATQLSGLVDDNQSQLGPVLDSIDTLITTLQNHQDQLGKVLHLAAVYIHLAGGAAGNGHWIDAYLCGGVPPNYVTGTPEVPSNYTPPTHGCEPTKAGGR